jgi:hypothetical protein
VFTIPEIVLLILKIANAIIQQVGDQKQFDAGVDSEIAKVSQAIMAKTQAGKAIMEKVNALSDKDVDAGLSGLEPK